MYGAIGDGTSHPLSSVASLRSVTTTGWTLVQWQALFPLATALTQEVDFLAWQAAIAAAAITGGTIVGGSHRYIMTQTGATIDTLVIPPCNSGGTPQVNIVGVGSFSTYLVWNRDLGTGKFAICCGDVTGTPGNGLGRYGNAFEGTFANFQIVGPASDPSYGTLGSNMSGMAWGAKRNMESVRATKFYAGFDIVGDHSTLSNCSADGCHYGWYFSNPSSALFGDIIFINCTAGLAGWAALAIHGSASIACEFHTCFFGTSPYGIFMEAGSIANSTALLGCLFDRCMFEFCGNACIWDDYIVGTPVNNRQILDVVFRMCNWSMSATYKMTFGGRTAPSMFHLGTVLGMRFDGVLNAFGMVPGTVSVFDAYLMSCFHFAGSIGVVWTNCVTATLPFMTSANFTVYNENTFDDLDSPRTSGTIEMVNGSNGITAGNLVQFHLDSIYQAAVNDLFVAGVAVMTPIAGPTGLIFVPIQKTGRAAVAYTGTLTTTLPFKPAASGAVQIASAMTDGNAMAQYVSTIDATHINVMLKIR